MRSISDRVQAAPFGPARPEAPRAGLPGVVSAALAVLLLANAYVGHAQGPNPPVIEDAALDLAVQRARALLEQHMETLDVPGMQVAVWKDGRMLWSEGLGWADAENRAPATRLTRFPIGSVSKALTAVIAARLVDRGVLDVDAPIQRYVARFPARQGRISPRMLGQHLSGIRHYRRGESPGANRHYETVNEALDLFLEDALLFEPGTRYSYSSFGFTLLSAALESASGRDFRMLLEEEVVRPLELEGTMANAVDRLIPFRSQGYTFLDSRRKRADLEDPSYMWAAGGLLSTAEDLVRVGASLLEPGHLSADALALLFTEGRSPAGERTYYGFGWNVYTTREGRTVYSHSGQLDYARAHLVILPQERIVLAVLANTGTRIGFNNGEAVWLAELFVTAWKADEQEARREWAGVYSFRSVEEEGTVPGRLTLYESGGFLRGLLTIGTRTTTVPAAVEVNGTLELFAVPGSWRKLWLTPSENGYEGRWEIAGLPSGRLWVAGELLDIQRLDR